MKSGASDSLESEPLEWGAEGYREGRERRGYRGSQNRLHLSHQVAHILSHFTILGAVSSIIHTEQSVLGSQMPLQFLAQLIIAHCADRTALESEL